MKKKMLLLSIPVFSMQSIASLCACSTTKPGIPSYCLEYRIVGSDVIKLTNTVYYLNQDYVTTILNLPISTTTYQIRVEMGGHILKEDTDFTFNYARGELKVLGSAIVSPDLYVEIIVNHSNGIPISLLDIDYQTKTLLGIKKDAFIAGYDTLEVPSFIKKIGPHAFANRFSNARDKFITKVIYNNNLETIEDYAFCGCDALTNATSFPNSLQTIGKHVFDGSTNLSGLINFGYSLKKIDHSAFFCCKKITGWTNMPDDMEHIGDFAFAGCSALVNKLHFSQTISYIGISAFANCTNISWDFKFPLKFDKIPDGLFFNCVNIKGQLPAMKVKSYGAGCFENCTGLTSVLFAPSTTEINAKAFRGCKNIAGEFTLPAHLTTIGDEAFKNCTLLGNDGYFSLIIPHGVTTLSSSCFENCVNINSITFHSEVLQIGSKAFAGCTNLGKVIFEMDEKTHDTKLRIIGNSAFENDEHLFMNDDQDSSNVVTFPGNFHYIGQNAFKNCKKFKGRFDFSNYMEHNGIEIHESAFENASLLEIKDGGIISIGKHAFYNIHDLKSFHSTGHLAYVEEEAFASCPELEVSFADGYVFGEVGPNAFNGCKMAYTSDPFGKPPTSLNILEPTAGSTVQDQRIGSRAFKNVIQKREGYDVTQIYIGNTNVTFGNNVFEGCNAVNHLLIMCKDNQVPNWAKVESSNLFVGFPEEGIIEIDMKGQLDDKGKQELKNCLHQNCGLPLGWHWPT